MLCGSYEKAELLRQQIEMAEIDAYDELVRTDRVAAANRCVWQVAQRAEEVDQVRHQLTIRQEVGSSRSLCLIGSLCLGRSLCVASGATGEPFTQHAAC